MDFRFNTLRGKQVESIVSIPQRDFSGFQVLRTPSFHLLPECWDDVSIPQRDFSGFQGGSGDDSISIANVGFNPSKGF